MPLTAIVLAAGEGTRMKSRHPKVVHNLLDKPIVWWTVRAAQAAGVERTIVVVGNHADEIKAALSDFDGIEYVEQTDRLGTGHAVRVVRDALGGFNGPVVVINGDAPLMRSETIKALVDETRAHHNACTLLTMTPPDPTGYGRVIFSDGHVAGIVEHKDATPEQRKHERECNVGVYCFCGGRLTANIDLIANDNTQGEYYLTDMVGIYVGQGEPVSAVHVDDYHEALGVNSRSQLADATRIMQERINEHLMAEGVTMLDPTTVWVGADVTVGQDTEILPMTMLYGATHIGSDCVIGPNTRLTDTTIGDGCVVDETVALSAVVEDGATCGPRAYLRPGAHLMPHAKAGTHVEIKNSTIGAGSKVPHLSYIGDTTMGEGVNVGAGSITCNYDGYHKFPTTIGDHVFIGSDTMMVAPVTIGDGALVGASSCITQDVPADALALERSEQRIVEGYAATRRAKLEKED
ncbi:bifunctional UDP-N-acetylglucosamine diphosphorylase/glucosamine-1-phosphate N-acetyltransferase GlmU [Atopobium sp. oral taxon 199]|uniref:bifunctional UDP-N-acetylglucosamine diphosphorylase/glucosamine-1-phosphate N-acetyltransferase GlmU n=1 Tax=Atopobium sp. oral taxon 199 TaxID=712156 RepID=UPI00034E99C1|nr:bifunctional UDP-N-acetylglucosamine diphosphorylase/glucosamine-1-phosphate N-acetyltransferase GlmU [Atopobium sp. oral taxon 199]EPD77379.1 UDP-N-acetylglucosamine diphosphorylase/glucosamine-1-phosphate N-acetyltransferase [Atopobium sp. oral taxon 199 str. F0494]